MNGILADRSKLNARSRERLETVIVLRQILPEAHPLVVFAVAVWVCR